MQHRMVLRVMTSEPAVAHEDTGFAAMVELMAGSRVDMLPVVDGGGRVLGVVTSTDLLAKESVMLRPNRVFALLHRHVERVKARGTTAGELMSTPAVTITPDADITRAARLMADHDVHTLPVVDPAGKLVAVVSRSDVLRVFLRHDHEIAEDIDREVFVGALGIDPTKVEVTVSDGIVRLGGIVERRSWVSVLGALARQVDGVVDVVNAMTYSWDDTLVSIPDPMVVDITHEPQH
jgi:CBS domain-containing protein